MTSRLPIAVLAVLVVFVVFVVGILALGYAAFRTSSSTSELLAPEPYVAPPSPVAAATTPVAPVEQPPAATPVVAPAWVAKIAVESGIPAPAVRAYANAQLAEPKGCEVGWTTLAGIGWVESQHGTVGGRTLDDDGRSDTAVLGPALDGDPFAAIPATPKTTAWHGDPLWDHAVGPMQFIPSTWEEWGTDGDGDGVADPHDLDDAARTAVSYLCADGHDLTSGAGWADAIFGYNHDQSYVDSVHAAATTYAERTED